MIVRLWSGFLAIFAVVVLALDVAAYAYVGRTVADVMQPVLLLPEGAAAYAAEMRRVAVAVALLDLPLLAIVGAAAYGAAALAIRPLLLARAREERFAADAAHELRTPLARIAALAQTAAAQPGGERAALDTIGAIALESATLVGDLLTAIRAERVAPELNEPVDLARLAERAAADHRCAGVSIEVIVTERDRAYVLGDERRLIRLAGNLVQNAVRHAHARVVVSVVPAAGTVRLCVDDDGDGVPAPLRARIFERFVRADDDGSGTGLGLSIAREIARAHHGEMTLEGGSRFVATLPRFTM